MWLGVGQWGWSGLPKAGHSPSLLESAPFLSSFGSPARVLQGVAEGPGEGGARAPGRRPRGHITRRWLPPRAPRPPASPAAARLRLRRVAARGRGGAGSRVRAGRGRRLLGCQRGAARARGGAPAGRSRWPGAASAAAARALGECSIHPPPQVSLSGPRRRGPPVSIQPPPPRPEAGGNGGEVSALAGAPGSGASQVLEGGGAGPGLGTPWPGRGEGGLGERRAAARQGPPRLPCPLPARGRRASRACLACPTSGGRAGRLWAPAAEPGTWAR